MKICFSTLACPEWDLETILARAEAFGYDGVDFFNLREQIDLPKAPAFSTEAETTRQRFTSAGIEIVALSCSVAFDSSRKRHAARAMEEAKRYVEAAAAVRARFVRVLATDSTESGGEQDRLTRAGERLVELGEYAGDAGVRIVVENAGSFVRCESMWWLIDRVRNPRVGACWNPVSALDGVEKPSKSIPTLGSKIHYFKVRNVKVGGDNAFRHAELDTGDLDLKHTIELLRGIGYEGYLCYELDRLWNLRLAEVGTSLGALPAPEEALKKSADLLRGWIGTEAEAATK